MIVVIDTNELLHMAAARGLSPLIQAWETRKFMIAISAQLLAEFATVAARADVRRFLPPLRSQRFSELLVTRSIIVEPASEFPLCRDANDNMVVATAVAAQAKVLISLDRDLYDDPLFVAQMLEQWQIEVRTPSSFLRMYM